MNPLEPSKVNTSRLTLFVHTLTWGIVFLMVYAVFTIIFGMITGLQTGVFLKSEWRDSSLAMTVLLYIGFIAFVFGFYGFAISAKILSNWLLQLLTVVPLALLGFIIWFVTYRSIGGATSDIGNMSWFLFMIYALWAMPIIEYLEYYLPTSNQVKVAALLISFIPSLSTYIGIRCATYITRHRREAKLWIRFAAIPIILLLALIISILIPKSSEFTWDMYPRVDGATAAIPLGKILVHELTGLNKPMAADKVSFQTTHNAYVNLIENKADIIFVAGPSDEELQLAEQKGVKLKLTPIGKDAFIFLVHQNNSVKQLTVEQIQDIYTGKLTNWQEVQGEDNAIIAFQREKNSGSQTFMEKKVMKDIQLASPPTTQKSEGMGGLIDAVADYENSKHAIGYSFYYFANEMHKREAVKFLAINGVEPNKANIINGQYPYTAILYAVTRENGSIDSSVNRLLEWLASEEGTKAIEQGGFVPIAN
ncbi:Phosphate-binding protein PstS precursor [compost metagenome]